MSHAGMATRAACACLAATLLAAPGASAQTSPTAVLRYERGADAAQCPDVQGLRDTVAARLGYDPFRDAAPTTVRASITRHRRRLRGRVEGFAVVGHRSPRAARSLRTAALKSARASRSRELSLIHISEPTRPY